MMEPSQLQERRRHPRFLLDLPMDHGALDSPSPHGGIVIDGSETGLLIYSLRDIAVDAYLNIAVLFANEFELTYFNAITKIVRKVCSQEGQRGYGYGLHFVRVSEENFRRLRQLLRTYELAHPENAAPLARRSRFLSVGSSRRPEKKWSSFTALSRKLSI